MRTTLILLLVLAMASPAWAQSGSLDLPAAVARLADGKTTEARIETARLLGASKDPRALEPLVATLQDSNRDVRWAVVEALGELGDPRAVAPLVEYLKRPEAYRWGRRLVANALGAIGDATAVEPLLALLGDEDPFARRDAALALLRMGDPRALPKIAQLLKDNPDETLVSVRRELARAEEGPRQRVAATRKPPIPQNASGPLRPREWGGLRVGIARVVDARERFGAPVQDTPEFLLFRGDQFQRPLRADSVVVNGDTKGLIDSIFVFPAWGTLDRDVRGVFGPGKLMPYGEFLKATGRTAYGAGTRSGGKLHYLPPDLPTEWYPEMGVLVVYDTAETAARERLVKLLIVY